MKHIRILITICSLIFCISITAAAAESPAADGTFGRDNSLSWEFYEDGTLEISGEGEMDRNSGDVPWEQYNDSVKSVVISSGVQNIMKEAFSDCSALESVSLPDTLVYIEREAFSNCSSLKSITLPKSLIYIGVEAFSGCTSIEQIVIPDNIRFVSADAFWECNTVQISVPDAEYKTFWVSDTETITADVYVPEKDSEYSLKYSAPANVKVSNTRDGIKIQWDSVSDGAVKCDGYYIISSNGKKAGSLTECAWVTADKNSVIIKDEWSGSYCNYKVCAYKEFDFDMGFEEANGKFYYGKYSSTSQQYRLTSPAVRKYKSSNGNVVMWSKVNGATGYVIYRKASSTSAYTKVAAVKGAGVLKYVDKERKDSSEYSVKAYFKNSEGKVYYSGYGFKIAQVSNLDITAETDNCNAVLNWDRVSNATKYKIYRAASENGTYEQIGETQGSSFKDTGISTGKTYYYKVRAYYGSIGGATSVSKSISISRSEGLDAPGKVKNLKISPSSTYCRATLSWEASEGATQYRIYSASSKNGKYTMIGTTTKTSFTCAGLTGGSRCYYKVKAYNYDKGSAYSSVVSCTVKKYTPQAVEGLTCECTDGVVTLNWKKSKGASCYRIYKVAMTAAQYQKLEQNKDCSDILVSSNLMYQTADTTFTDRNQEGQLNYFYVIVACNGTQQSKPIYEIATY